MIENFREADMRILDETIFKEDLFKNSFKEFEDENIDDEINCLRFADGETYDEVMQFYNDSGFLYPGKKHLLFDDEAELKNTWEKILKKNEVVKVVFYKKAGKILGSAMSAQYINSVRVFQHICVLPQFRRSIIPKLISLANTYAGLKDRDMDIAMVFYQAHTRWAVKSLEGFKRKVGDEREISVFPLSYLLLDISEIGFLSFAKNREVLITELLVEDKDFIRICELLKMAYPDLYLNAYALNEKEGNLSIVKRNYSKIGLCRDRKYLVAKDKSGKILGFAFCDIASKGINFSHFFDHFQLFIFDKQNYSETVASLILPVIDFYKSRKRSNAYCLISDQMLVENLLDLGFIQLKVYRNCIFDSKNDKFDRFFEFLAKNRKDVN